MFINENPNPLTSIGLNNLHDRSSRSAAPMNKEASKVSGCTPELRSRSFNLYLKCPAKFFTMGMMR